MDNLKNLKNEEIVKLIKNGKVEVADIVDSGICPTCFDKQNNNILYGNNKNKMIFENDKFECFFVGNPRADGHVAISTKKHFKDMMEIDDETCKEIFLIAKKLMNLLKETYNAESVYLCTMCDGPMNHFHIQLIPRYSFEKRGSKNFVKPRFEYREDKEKLKKFFPVFPVVLLEKSATIWFVRKIRKHPQQVEHIEEKTRRNHDVSYISHAGNLFWSALRNWNSIWDRRTSAEIWRKSPRRMRHYSSPDRRDLAWI